MLSDDIFRLLLIILLLSNEKDNCGCGCGNNSNNSNNGVSNINEVIIISLLLCSSRNTANDNAQSAAQNLTQTTF